MQCSLTTLKKWRARFREAGPENMLVVQDLRLHPAPKPLKMNENELEQVREAMRQNPFRAVCRLPVELQIDVHPNTMRKVVKNTLRLKYRKAAKKTFLTEDHKLARLNFARRFVGFPPLFWTQVVFMDEKVFSTHKDGRVGVWRPDDTRFQEQYFIPKKMSGRRTKCFWAWMSGDGPGQLVRIDRRLTAVQYVDILENHLLPGVNARYPNNLVVYIVEDNSAIHTARVVNEWYQNHPRFQRIRMPAKSPDFNVIENLWAEMVREVMPLPRDTDELLLESVRASWVSLFAPEKQDFCLRLTNSVPTRLQNIINARGACTKY